MSPQSEAFPFLFFFEFIFSVDKKKDMGYNTV